MSAWIDSRFSDCACPAGLELNSLRTVRYKSGLITPLIQIDLMKKYIDLPHVLNHLLWFYTCSLWLVLPGGILTHILSLSPVPSLSSSLPSPLSLTPSHSIPCVFYFTMLHKVRGHFYRGWAFVHFLLTSLFSENNLAILHHLLFWCLSSENLCCIYI